MGVEMHPHIALNTRKHYKRTYPQEESVSGEILEQWFMNEKQPNSCQT